MTLIKEFFDKDTWTLTYVVYDDVSKDAIIMDAVWDYEPAASKMSTHSIVKVIDFIKQQKLTVCLILDTHAHADHVSGSYELKKVFPNAQLGIGENIIKVQKKFKEIYNLHPDFPVDGRQFDLLLKEGELYRAGTLKLEVLYTPGHTPACCSYIIDENVFTGDVLFMPDYGTGRCDFPLGSANELFDSVQKIYSLPEHFKVYTGHDYQPGGRPVKCQSTIAEQKLQNIHIKATTLRKDFVEFREQRDKQLSAPRLLLPSLQVNIDAGRLPEAEGNGVSYLKIPVQNNKESL